jgi:hypothetical protein
MAAILATYAFDVGHAENSILQQVPRKYQGDWIAQQSDDHMIISGRSIDQEPIVSINPGNENGDVLMVNQKMAQNGCGI